MPSCLDRNATAVGLRLACWARSRGALLDLRSSKLAISSCTDTPNLRRDAYGELELILLHAAAVIGTETGSLDQAPPALDLLLDVDLELRADLPRNIVALRLELFTHGRIRMRCFRGLQQALGDVGGRAAPDKQSEPDLSSKFGIAELREGRHSGHRTISRRARDREGA